MGFNTFPCNPYPISTEELNKGNNDDLNTRVAALESDVSDLNSNKANQITIAPFFNAETAYTAGDLVYYNGLTYRCTNDHEGEWDADDFAATTIANELDELKSGLNDLETLTVLGDLQNNVLSLYAFKVGKIAYIRVGDISNLPAADTTIQRIIPVGYRPSQDIEGMCTYTITRRITGTADPNIALTVKQNGDVMLYNYGDAISTQTAIGQLISYPIA